MALSSRAPRHALQELTNSKMEKHQAALEILTTTLKEQEKELRKLEKKRTADEAEEAKLQAQCDKIEDQIFGEFSAVIATAPSIPRSILWVDTGPRGGGGGVPRFVRGGLFLADG